MDEQVTTRMQGEADKENRKSIRIVEGEPPESGPYRRDSAQSAKRCNRVLLRPNLVEIARGAV